MAGAELLLLDHRFRASLGRILAHGFGVGGSVTTTMRPTPASRIAAMTWPRIGRPATACITLGVADFIRLPLARRQHDARALRRACSNCFWSVRADSVPRICGKMTICNRILPHIAAQSDPRHCSVPMDSPALLFDLDGTLVDTAPDLLGALNAVLESEGRATVDPQTLRHMVGHGARSLIEQAMAATGERLPQERLPGWWTASSPIIAAISWTAAARSRGLGDARAASAGGRRHGSADQ